MEKKTKKTTRKAMKVKAIPKVEVKPLFSEELKKKVIKTINHPNRQVIAEKIFDGVSGSELIAEYGNVKVAEIKRIISACKGKPWVCTHCG
jgi:hypothetical protein